MNVITKEEFLQNKAVYLQKIKDGAVFIYPTDTIYGIGCDATNKDAVLKLRALKNRGQDHPLSVIVPSKEWIEENCEVFGKGQDWLDKLPGPYTLVFKLKMEESVATPVNNNNETLGVRIPDIWFSSIVNELQIPVITTSVNKTAQTFMTTLEDCNDDIKQNVDFIIYEGPKQASASQVVDLRDGEPITLR